MRVSKNDFWVNVRHQPDTARCAVEELIHRRLSVFVWLEINVQLATILISSDVFYNQCHFLSPLIHSEMCLREGGSTQDSPC